MNRIEQIVTTVQKSTIDLDFIKGIFLEENSEELAFLDFNPAADLSKGIPWDKVKFRAESLARGSTILNFSLSFKEPPRNPCDASVCRLIQLIIKTIVFGHHPLRGGGIAIFPICREWIRKSCP